MKRIDTPNSIIIWNGTDRGFNDTPGPPPTEFDAPWCNNVQESLTRPLEQQNIVLDGANFDQWTDMLQSYAFSGTPTIATGGVLTVQSGGQLGLAAGSIFTSAAGVTFSLLGNVTIGTTSANTLTIESTFDRVILASMGITGATGGNPVDFPEGATVAAGKDLGLGAASTITGDATTIVTAGTFDTIDTNGSILVGSIVPYPGSPGFTAGTTTWDGRAWAVGNGIGAAPRLARPVLSYTSGPKTTALAITDTGASVSLNMIIGEKAKIVATAQAKNDSVGSTIRFSIDVGGVVVGNNDTYYESIAAASVSQTVTRIIEYTAVANAVVSFKARYGANAGNTTLNDISIEASHI